MNVRCACWTGCIRACGWSWGNGWGASTNNQCWTWWNGWNGANWWQVIYAYMHWTPETICVNGWAWGCWGCWYGWTDWTAWTAWTDWRKLVYMVSTDLDLARFIATQDEEYLLRLLSSESWIEAVAWSTQALRIIANDTELLSDVLSYTTIVNALISDSTCLWYIAWSHTSMVLVKDNTTIMNALIVDSTALWAISQQDFFDYVLENETFLSTCVWSTAWANKVNSIDADDLLEPIYFYTWDLWYDSWTTLSEDDDAMETLENNTNAMLIIESNEEAISYFWIPSEYQEVERIGITWSQYINTWLYAWNNIQVETDIEVNSTAQDCPIFWCIITDNVSASVVASYYHLTPYSNAFYFWLNWWEWHWWTYSPVVWTKYKIVFNNSNNSLNINWVDVASCSWTAWYNWSKLWIGTRRSPQSTTYYAYANYYNFKMYNKTTWEYERDFVPCYRKSDWVIWMYDKITKTFFTNYWTWTFTKWHDVNVKRSEFQKVEYIQSSWTQRIDTCITPNSNTKLQSKLSRLQNNDYVDIWYYAWNDLQDWRLFVRSEWEWTLDIPWWSWSWNRLVWPMSTDWTAFELEVWNYYIKDLISQQTYTWTASTFTWYSTIKLSRNQSTNKNNSDRFYYIKIREWDTLVRDFIPCYRKSDNVIWLIDDVNKVFYTNAWTWTFTKWWDIN